MQTLLAFPGDDVAQILLVPPGTPATFQVAYDFTALLPAGDTVASANWTSPDALLAVASQSQSGAITQANFSSSAPQGHSALVNVQVTGASGETHSRSFRVLAVYR